MAAVGIRVKFYIDDTLPNKIGIKTLLSAHRRIRHRGVKVFASPTAKYKDGTFVQDAIVANELGDPPRLPARPVLRTVMRKNIGKYRNRMRLGIRRLIEDDIDSKTLVKILGKELQEDLIHGIRMWSMPMNAFRTILKKGFNDPLVETGKLMRSIKYAGIPLSEK